MVSKHAEIWSGLFIPDSRSRIRILTFYPSRIQGSIRHRIPDPQHCLRLPIPTWLTYLSTCLLVCPSELIKLSLLIEGGSGHPPLRFRYGTSLPTLFVGSPSTSLTLSLSTCLTLSRATSTSCLFLSNSLSSSNSTLLSSPFTVFTDLYFLPVSPCEERRKRPHLCEDPPFHHNCRNFSCLSKCIPSTCICFFTNMCLSLS